MDIMQVLGSNSGMTLFKGSTRRCQLARSVAEICVSEMLARQEFVHWVDGACRIDPSRLIPLLSKRSNDIRGCLSRMLVSRGFTLHQFLQQIERLPNEIALTNSSLVVIDGILQMHADELVRKRESRAILNRSVQILESLGKQGVNILIIERNKSQDRRHTESLEYIQRRCLESVNISRKPRTQNVLLNFEKSGLEMVLDNRDRSQLTLQESLFRLKLEAVNRGLKTKKLEIKNM